MKRKSMKRRNTMRRNTMRGNFRWMRGGMDGTPVEVAQTEVAPVAPVFDLGDNIILIVDLYENDTDDMATVEAC